MPLDFLFLQTTEEQLDNRVVPAVAFAAHAGHKLVVPAPTVEVITTELGVFNRSSQR